MLLIIVGQCSINESVDGADKTGSEEASLTTNPVASAKPQASDVPSTNWSYSHRNDPVRNGEIIEATIRSENSTDLDFPYGRVHLNITVRKHPEWGQDVIFVVDEGQILCRIRDCSGTINFNGTPERLSLVESGDNDSSIVFAQYAPSIIRKLKSSEKVIVELPFFQNGNRHFTFISTGLEWPPKPPKPIASSSVTKCVPELAKSVGLSCDK